MSLRVSGIDGRVTLTMPKHAPLRAARAFLAEQEDWIAKALSVVDASVRVVPGCCLPVEGVTMEVVAAEFRSPRIEGGRIRVTDSRTGPRIEAWLKRLARDRLTRAVSEFTSELGIEAGRITLRDTRSRWGSCSARGDLMFSWRLIMAPTDVLRYVAAHEVAHLRHLDHSQAFWALTREIFPQEAEARDWLRKQGSSLHRYRFEGDRG